MAACLVGSEMCIGDRTGHTTCVFKGRRGPWFVQKGLKTLLDKIPLGDVNGVRTVIG